MIRVIVLGSNGMAGHVLVNFLKRFPEKYLVLSVARSKSKVGPDIILNLADFDGLKALIIKWQPDVIINSAGILNLSAENAPAEAILINSFLPHFLVEVTKETKCKIIHVSTDCVFSGKKGGYLENSTKDGIGYYAQTKALGEINNQKDLTIRTSIIGPEIKSDRIGLFDWFMNQKGQIFGYTNAIWSGVTTMQLARIIDYSIEKNLSGLIHAVNNQKISKYDLLLIFKSCFQVDDITIMKKDDYYVDKSLVNSRVDFQYPIPSYLDMVIELKEWVESQKSLYNY
ncbi:dTDP-4-dehydrorhamnose reductase family protein [Lacihabitans soyangensis]|uniref:dTDP-4-dehydrorhamnose reductase n=1 Tax=Lacihabitans soyangensis TaxID=869394 RepID=A0AAE3KSS1_9BACT|nr:SDR family oxidoreductase [Lacihabitans soyangensis]MCP9762909.1 SDR family oxidoreductase [Lacihabitans soyangensis]